MNPFEGMMKKQIEKDTRHLKAAWLSFLICGVFCLAIGAGLSSLFSSKIVEAKNATIEAKQAEIQQKETVIAQLKSDNEKIAKQLTDSKSPVVFDSTPLKQRAKILSRQILEYASNFDNNHGDPIGVANRFSGRFESRVRAIISQLDEAGQHSDVLDKIITAPVLYGGGGTSAEVTTIAKEIGRLADNIKEPNYIMADP